MEDTSKAERSERLFRSAVSAYCALIRPSKRDAAQLDDLTLPLLPLVSVEGRRYAAAALSESAPQPTVLVRRLAEEPLEISAPLLTRSKNLSDVDLIGLIGRHGIDHARAISRRPNLNANIVTLVKALGASHSADEKVEDMENSAPTVDVSQIGSGTPETVPHEPVDAAEEVRVQLREMMQPARSAEPAPGHHEFDWVAAAAAYPKLVSTGLSGSDAFFHTALADALGISFGAAQSLDEDHAPGLTVVLRALDLSVEQAFLVVMLAYPYGLVGHENVRNFVESYRKLERGEARDTVLAWRTREAGSRTARARDWEPTANEPANDSAAMRELRAS